MYLVKWIGISPKKCVNMYVEYCIIGNFRSKYFVSLKIELPDQDWSYISEGNVVDSGVTVFFSPLLFFVQALYYTRK